MTPLVDSGSSDVHVQPSTSVDGLTFRPPMDIRHAFRKKLRQRVDLLMALKIHILTS